MRIEMYKDGETILVHVTKVDEMKDKGWSTEPPIKIKKEVK